MRSRWKENYLLYTTIWEIAYSGNWLFGKLIREIEFVQEIEVREIEVQEIETREIDIRDIEIRDFDM